MPITVPDDNILRVYVASGCVIEQNGKFLLVQEKKPVAYGLWNLPAGKVEKGKNIQESAIREAKEETGYDVEIIKHIGIYHQDGEKSVRHAFSAKIIGGALNIPEDEILDAKWFTYNEILELNKQNKIRNYWVIRAIEDYLAITSS